MSNEAFSTPVHAVRELEANRMGDSGEANAMGDSGEVSAIMGDSGEANAIGDSGVERVGVKGVERVNDDGDGEDDGNKGDDESD